MDNDEEDGVQEDNEAPIYAETDKIEFKTGVSVAKSPYTKIFEVSLWKLIFLETYQQV